MKQEDKAFYLSQSTGLLFRDAESCNEKEVMVAVAAVSDVFYDISGSRKDYQHILHSKTYITETLDHLRDLLKNPSCKTRLVKISK